MLIRFATRDRNSALGFLKKFYPSSVVEDTDVSAGPVLDLVEKDIIRIPDPECHDGAILPSKNWPDDEGAQKRVVEVLDTFHKETLKLKEMKP